MRSKVNELEERMKKLKLGNRMEIDSLELKSEDLAPEDSELKDSESETPMPEDSELKDSESETPKPKDPTLIYSALEYSESEDSTLEDLISYKSTSEEEKSLSRNVQAMFAVRRAPNGQENSRLNVDSGCKRKDRDAINPLERSSKRPCYGLDVSEERVVSLAI